MLKNNGCVFCKIISGEHPCFKIYEDDKYIVFLDRFPESEAMTLIVTKEHKPGYFTEIEDETLTDMLKIAKKLARKIDSKMPGIIRTNLLIEGMDVDHFHVKLKPAYEGKHIPNTRLDVTLEDLEKVHKMLTE